MLLSIKWSFLVCNVHHGSITEYLPVGQCSRQCDEYTCFHSNRSVSLTGLQEVRSDIVVGLSHTYRFPFQQGRRNQGCGTTQTSQWFGIRFRLRFRFFTGSGSGSGSGPGQQAKTNTTRLRLSTRCFPWGTYTLNKLVAHGCRFNSRYRIVRKDQD